MKKENQQTEQRKNGGGRRETVVHKKPRKEFQHSYVDAALKAALHHRPRRRDVTLEPKRFARLNEKRKINTQSRG